MGKTTKKFLISGLLLFLAVLIGLFFYQGYKPDASGVKPSVVKKKIVIFTTVAGGGHASVSRALNAALKDEFDVKVVQEVYSELLQSAEPLARLTGGRWRGVDFYNYLTGKNWFGCLNLIQSLGVWGTLIQREKITAILRDYLEKEKPDFVVSVVPLINGMIVDAARKCNIPFLLVPTDFDCKNFLSGIQGEPYDKFYLSVPFDVEQMKTSYPDLAVRGENVINGSIPLRPNFFTEKNIHQIKKELLIPENKPVILVIMGSQGSPKMYALAKQLRLIHSPVHVVMCLGNNSILHKKISKIYFPAHVTVSLLGFTDKIPELMSISSFIISKSGSLSVCEALYMDLPIIIDNSTAIIKPELFNHELIRQNNFGCVANSMTDICCISQELLRYPKKLDAFKLSLSLTPKINGALAVKNAIENILLQQEIIKIQGLAL